MEERIPGKDGIVERGRVMYVGGARSIAKIAAALANETRAKIIESLAEGPKDLDNLAQEMGQSKANISSQIKKLEDVGIVTSVYMPGTRGIKKYVELRIDALVISLGKRERE